MREDCRATAGRNSGGTIAYITDGSRTRQSRLRPVFLMTPARLRTIIDAVARGELDAAAAHAEIIAAVRARPFEDLGFARVDHHRAARQGFPEVVLGLGKTPAQIAAIAAEIVRRGSTLL